jgi:hypothetical protein
MNALTLLSSQITPIGNLQYLLSFKEDNEDNFAVSDETLVTFINGANYKKANDAYETASQRGEERINSSKQQINALKNEFDGAVRTAENRRPGSGPSSLFLNNSDPDAVDRYNSEVRAHNLKIDEHRRFIDIAKRAEERYQDKLQIHNELVQRINEQVEAKHSELKPALDKDIVVFMGKIQGAVYTLIHNQQQFFAGFLTIYLAKKAYTFLAEKIEDPSCNISMNDIFRRLENEIDHLIKNNTEDIKSGYEELFVIFDTIVQTNKIIFDEIQSTLLPLPYAVVDVKQPEIEQLLSITINQEFSFKDIVNPVELEKVAQEVVLQREKAENNITVINDILKELDTFFIENETIRNTITEKIEMMRENKKQTFGDNYEQYIFAIEPLYEYYQDNYLSKYKILLEAIQVSVEDKVNKQLSPIISSIVKKEIFIKPAQTEFDENRVFNFLAQKNHLLTKKNQHLNDITQLNTILEAIDKQPQEQAESTGSYLTMILAASLIPVVNIITSIMAYLKVQEYDAALSSHSVIPFKTLRTKLISHLFYALIGIGTVALFFSAYAVYSFYFTTDEINIPLFATLVVSCLISIIIFSIIRNKLTNYEASAPIINYDFSVETIATIVNQPNVNNLVNEPIEDVQPQEEVQDTIDYNAYMSFATEVEDGLHSTVSSTTEITIPEIVEIENTPPVVTYSTESSNLIEPEFVRNPFNEQDVPTSRIVHTESAQNLPTIEPIITQETHVLLEPIAEVIAPTVTQEMPSMLEPITEVTVPSVTEEMPSVLELITEVTEPIVTEEMPSVLEPITEVVVAAPIVTQGMPTLLEPIAGVTAPTITQETPTVREPITEVAAPVVTQEMPTLLEPVAEVVAPIVIQEMPTLLGPITEVIAPTVTQGIPTVLEPITEVIAPTVTQEMPTVLEPIEPFNAPTITVPTVTPEPPKTFNKKLLLIGSAASVVVLAGISFFFIKGNTSIGSERIDYCHQYELLNTNIQTEKQGIERQYKILDELRENYIATSNEANAMKYAKRKASLEEIVGGELFIVAAKVDIIKNKCKELANEKTLKEDTDTYNSIKSKIKTILDEQ